MSFVTRPVLRVLPTLRASPLTRHSIPPLVSLRIVTTPPRYLFTTTKMSAKDESTRTQQADPPIAEKLKDLRKFMDNHKTVILVTKATNSDAMHARVMAQAEISPDWKFRFIYDRDSHKDNEVADDSHATIAVDGSDKHDGWVSIAGKAKRVTDDALVKKLYTPMLKAWFGDKGDGVHTGGPEDPRMAVLEISPEEIRHYHQQKTQVGLIVDVVASAISGNTANPGELREISGQEIQAAWDRDELSEPASVDAL